MLAELIKAPELMLAELMLAELGRVATTVVSEGLSETVFLS